MKNPESDSLEPVGFCKICARFHAKHAAYCSALYTLHMSIVMVLLYSWRLDSNTKKYGELQDVYYGVQVAYVAIIGTQSFMMVLSLLLLFGIYKERYQFVVPWIIGCITFMALEAMAMVYSNVLRDHVNKQFDEMCRNEMSFFLCRALINTVAIYGVMRFYHLLKAGVTWHCMDSIEL